MIRQLVSPAALLTQAVWLVPAAGLAQETPPPEEPVWPTVRVEAYELEATPAFDTGFLSATAVLHLANDGTGPVTEVPVLLNRLLRVTAALGPGGAALYYDQSVVDFDDIPRLQVNHARIELPEPLAPGAVTSVTIAYEGYLTGYTEVGWSYVRDRIDPAFTILREDAFAYPLVGVPSMAARMRAGLLEFRYTATIAVPDSLVVANGGELVERVVGDGVARYTYRSIVPSWRMDFAIAPYRVLERDGTRVFHFPGDSAGAQRVFAALEEAKRLFTEWFGPLHRPAQFAVIALPEGWGSQADATAILQTAGAFTDPRALGELYHEISHLWNPPPRDEAHPRWEEGLAMYLQHRVAEVLDGGPPVARQARVVAGRVEGALARDPRLREIAMIDYGRHRMTNSSYNVGLLLFAALDEHLGRELADRIIGEYYQRYHETGATTRQLVRLASALSDGRSDPVFETWMLTTRWVDELEQWFPQ
jgi:hypothetical protein